MSSQQNFNFAVPRKCYATNKVLHSKDRASVQIQISDVSKKYYIFKM